MNFIEGLPKLDGKEVIMVVVDRFTKYAHFIALSSTVKTTFGLRAKLIWAGLGSQI